MKYRGHGFFSSGLVVFLFLYRRLLSGPLLCLLHTFFSRLLLLACVSFVISLFIRLLFYSLRMGGYINRIRCIMKAVEEVENNIRKTIK